MNKTVFVLGGCRSGKSRYALEMAQKASENNTVFIATCVPQDDEMKSRVASHRKERGSNWQTVEEPVHLPQAIDRLNGKAGIILVDCLTLWISNLLMENPDSESVLHQVQSLTRSVKASTCPVILVSNEVGAGIVPENQLARLYRDLVGWTNQAVTDIADQVVWVMAGIPVTIKG